MSADLNPERLVDESLATAQEHLRKDGNCGCLSCHIARYAALVFLVEHEAQPILAGLKTQRQRLAKLLPSLSAADRARYEADYGEKRQLAYQAVFDRLPVHARQEPFRRLVEGQLEEIESKG